MNEKRYFVSKNKGKFIEFDISHYTVNCFGAQTNQFEVRCAEPDDFSEFYSELISKQPNIKNACVSKTENSIKLYSNTYLASVEALLSSTPSQAFKPIFVCVLPFTPSEFQDAQQHLDSVCSVINPDWFKSGPTT